MKNNIYEIAFPNEKKYILESVRVPDDDQLRRVADDLGFVATSWSNPEQIDVQIYSLTLCSKSGQFQKRYIMHRAFELYRARMNQAEFDKEMETTLDGLPKPLKNWIADYAYSEGHSGGFENVVAIAEELSESLGKVVKQCIEEAVLPKKMTTDSDLAFWTIYQSRD